MMNYEVTFTVPVRDVVGLQDEVLEWDEEYMTPLRSQKVGVYELEGAFYRVSEVPVAGADYMTASVFVGTWDAAVMLARAAEKAGRRPKIFHESYVNIYKS